MNRVHDFIQSIMEVFFERDDFDPTQKEYRGYNDVLEYEADACSYLFGYELPHKNNMIERIKAHLSLFPDSKNEIIFKYLDSICLSDRSTYSR